VRSGEPLQHLSQRARGTKKGVVPFARVEARHSRILSPKRRVAPTPSVLRELAGRLQELEAGTNETNREQKAAGLATAEGRESSEHLLNRVLASMEHLNEVSQAMTRRLDELLKA
jgi:hypothetical protein